MEKNRSTNGWYVDSRRKQQCNKYGQHKWYILKIETCLDQMSCIAIFEFLAKSIYGEQLFQKESSKGRSV